jgi:hypothetical protein
MIFLTATGWPVNWSRAELSGSHPGQLWDISRALRDEPSRAGIKDIPDEAEGAHAYWLQVRVSRNVNVSNRSRSPNIVD